MTSTLISQVREAPEATLNNFCLGVELGLLIFNADDTSRLLLLELLLQAMFLRPGLQYPVP